MRIRAWMSGVCSSDLLEPGPMLRLSGQRGRRRRDDGPAMKPGRIALATLALLAATACDSRSDLRPLTVVGWGGSSQDAHRQAYWNGFTQSTGIALREDSWRGGVGVIRTKVIGGDASWDVVQEIGRAHV